MSYQRTNELVQGISDDHDIEVQYWKDELVNYVEPTSQVNSCLFLVFYWLNNSIMYILQVKKPASSSMLLLNGSGSEHDSADEIEAPPFSPIASSDFDVSLSYSADHYESEDEGVS